MLKILFLAILVLSLGYSKADQCVRGPSYWCKSIQNANECNAFKHCLQTVWTTHLSYASKKQLELSNKPNACTNCVSCLNSDLSRCQFDNFKQQIQELKHHNLPSESICTLLDQCNEHKLVDHNHIEYKFDSRFKCGIHPRNWCDTLETAKRCDSLDTCFSQWSRLKFKLKDSIDSESAKLNSEKTCGFCLYIFQKLRQSILENSTEINVRDYLEGACTLLPSQNLTDLCTKEVDTYLPEIYNMLRNNMDPGIICRVLKQCSDASLELVSEPTINLIDSISFTVLNDKDVVVKSPIQTVQVNSELLSGQKSNSLVGELERTMGVGCELCTIVMNAAKYMIETKTDSKKVLNFIEHQLCGRLGTLNNTCVEYVEQEGAEIIELLIKSVDPAMVCHAMGLCLKIQVEQSEPKFYDLNVRNPLNCTLCKVVFNQVKKMLADQRSQAKILTYIDGNLCQKIGKSRELCKTLIDAYGPLFLDIIARDVHPAQLCVMIGMCSSYNEVVAQETGAQSTQYCVMCEFLITVLEKYITQNSTIPEIEAWMSYVCQHVMPVSIRGECSDFVTTYGEIILNLLTSQVPPQKVCTFMKLCSNSEKGPLFGEETDLFKHKSSLVWQKEKSAVERVEESRGMSIRCTVCQFSIQYISNEYSLDKTEKAVEFTISNVCKLIPKSYRAHCDSMVDRHGVRLINFMDKFSEPVQVCSKIRFCPAENNKDALVNMIEVVPARPVENRNEVRHVEEPVFLGNKTLQCSLCLYVAEMIDNKLKENKTEEQITKELLLVCNLFPDTLKDQCSAFINEYGPYVVQLIASDLDPDVTCAALKLCEKTMQRDLIKQAILRKLQN
ncbi:proactivator polypeptide-like [Brachionus plicatilis]|uniref:Proactivator polypeptide-like n=1 Tax=Brachionus plicatilis TaxID=10195 RepID=A0A3M7QM61_BRAPC|nr:proactivator polypeptide-like [Brachionus plicatilis]